MGFLFLWLAASLIWLRQPITWSAYLQEPAAPNYEYYPNSDAAIHISGARYALLGEGINGGSMTDKPFYMAFLAGLQLFSDGSYLNLAALQTVILALGVGLIYLLGKELYNRDLGLLLAVFYILYEGNANQTTGHITAMYSKLFMSEPLMELFILLSVYLAVKWTKDYNPKYFYWMCGVSAFATLIRPHGLFVFSGLFIYSTLPFLKNLKTWLRKFSWGTFVYLSTLSPWLLTARLRHGYLPIFYKIERVIFNRFERQTLSQPLALASLDLDFLQLYPPGSAAEIGTIIEKIGWVLSNLINNLFKSLLIFPLSLRFDDLLTTINKPYWGITQAQSWQPSVNILFFVHLIIILTGFLAFWRKNRQAAFIPLVALLTYFLANSFARSSGGRHLYPVIWIVYVYYAAGILFLIRRLLKFFLKEIPDLLPKAQFNNSLPKNNRFLVLKICLVFLILGSYLPLIDLGFPFHLQEKGIPNQNQEEYLQSSQLPDAVNNLMEEGKISTLAGEIWYPIQLTNSDNNLFFYSSAVEIIRESPVKLTLNVTGEEIYLPDRSNVMIFQCGSQKTNLIKAAGIVLLDTQPFTVYWDDEEISNCR